MVRTRLNHCTHESIGFRILPFLQSSLLPMSGGDGDWCSTADGRRCWHGSASKLVLTLDHMATAAILAWSHSCQWQPPLPEGAHKLFHCRWAMHEYRSATHGLPASDHWQMAGQQPPTVDARSQHTLLNSCLSSSCIPPLHSIQIRFIFLIAFIFKMPMNKSFARRLRYLPKIRDIHMKEFFL